MQVLPTDLPGVLLLEPRVFGDARGFFFEAYNRRALNSAWILFAWIYPID
jgi:dTDP-4-dehydrorhamnose 3,5-epimerase